MQALYRRYRPKTFDEVVGQTMTITALKNQIIEDRVHHAYIFSGTRGTGKTSVAKIFARAVNCLEPDGANPCNQCKVCRGILDESLFDVMEIDAASNNSVDDIREIREHVAYAPAVAKKKVYIIDEVHMLSKGAFNALLKILEEPPAHALFILATTEPEKIPATILSRAQRFTFFRLKEEEIQGELARILDLEGRGYTEEGLSIIAAHSDGSMRDSLSILDQVLSTSDGVVDGEMVYDALGLTEEEGIFRIVDGILAWDGTLIVDAVRRAYDRGKNFTLLLDALIDYFRDLLFYGYTQTAPKGFSEKETEIFKAHAEAIDEDFGFRCLDLFQKGREQFRYAKDPKTVVEILLLKALRFNKGGGGAESDFQEEMRTSGKVEKKPPKKKKKVESVKEVREDAQGDEPPLRDDEDHAIIEGDKALLADEAWKKIQTTVHEKSVACAALLKDAEGAKVCGKQLTILFQPKFAFHIKMLKSEANEKPLAEGVRQVLGAEMSVRVEAVGDEDDPVLQSIARVFKDVTIEKE
ncbi:MAG: DNA polymerase III subunit gamma/tau [Peptoniphilus sp.]|nr:DNA polymerase III subunit gamma/tau [Peptoniphilus sp.]MDY3118904.1 DNA polymerase III subunit gamma/tau [Peptoniphilus sp.]